MDDLKKQGVEHAIIKTIDYELFKAFLAGTHHDQHGNTMFGFKIHNCAEVSCETSSKNQMTRLILLRKPLINFIKYNFLYSYLR